jgi:K+-transporting ATPase ATPase C chain
MIKEILNQFRTALIAFLILAFLTGVIYPLVVTGIAQWLFSWRANGSLIYKNKHVIGSELIGQSFIDPKYFWSRPSATSPFPYNAGLSSGSNLGTLNQKLLISVKDRITALQKADPDNLNLIPVDLVTASGSGLDPHISPAAALYQVSRIAKVRNISEQSIYVLIHKSIERRTFKILGEPRINVLLLNLELDALAQERGP